MFLKLNRVLQAATFDVYVPGWRTGEVATADIFRPVHSRRILVQAEHIVDVEPCEYNVRMRNNTPTHKDARDCWLAPTWGSKVTTVTAKSFTVMETLDEIEAMIGTQHVVESTS